MGAAGRVEPAVPPQLPTAARGSRVGIAQGRAAAWGTPSSLRPAHTCACKHTQTHTCVRCPAEPWHCPAPIPVSRRALDVLKDFVPGAQLPVLLYNGEPKTDTVTIEDFLEDKLGPPMSVAAPGGGTGPQRGRRGGEWGAGGQHPHASPCLHPQLRPRPRRFPSLVPRYRESSLAGNDVFHKFSAFIKNPVPAQDEGEELGRGHSPQVPPPRSVVGSP